MKNLLAPLLCLVLLAGCSVEGGSADEPDGSQSRTVVVASHDSWAMPKKVLARFTEETGYRVEVQPNGDAGQLTNKLVLTKGSPIADVAYGIDTTFASRAVDEGVLVDHTPRDLPASASSYALAAPADAAQLTPVDFGDVCVNIDDGWFRTRGKTPPKTLDDLTKPAYKGLFVTPGATTSWIDAFSIRPTDGATSSSAPSPRAHLVPATAWGSPAMAHPSAGPPPAGSSETV